MLTEIIGSLFDKGLIGNVDDILDLDDEVYSIITLTLSGGESLTIELFEDEELDTLHVRSKLGAIRNSARNVAMAYLAVAKGTEELDAYSRIGRVILDVAANTVQFVHAVTIPTVPEPEYMANLVLNFATGSMLLKPHYSRICQKAQVHDLSVDDAFFSDSEIVVELHPALRFAMLKPLQKEALSAFLLRENLCLERIDELFTSPIIDLYPVVADVLSLRLSCGNYSCTIEQIDISLEREVLEKRIRRGFDLYIALMAYLNIEPSHQAYHSSDELVEAILDMLDFD